MSEKRGLLPVFRAAATAEVREDYLRHYERRRDRTREQLALAAEFLRSDACVRGLERLRRSDAALPVPAKRQTVRNGKLRDIYFLPMEDALLLGLLNHALHAWDDRFSPALCANILFRGKGDAFVRIRQTPQFGSLYLFSADVRAYGDSIDGELLSAALGELSWLDPEFLCFAQRLIRDRRYMCGGRVYEDGVAVKTGIPLCGFFENVYLRELDFFLESRSAFYVRYADDLLFGTQRPEERDALAFEVRRFMAERKLTLHETKSRSIAPGEAFDFLGMRICGNRVDLTRERLDAARSTARSAERRLLRLFEANRLSPEKRLLFAVAAVNRILAESELEACFSQISVPDGLRQLDRLFCDTIRTAVTGKRGTGKYRITYDMLRQCGYRSLVNRYYRYLNDKQRETGSPKMEDS